jgi:serine acetyltransferase
MKYSDCLKYIRSDNYRVLGGGKRKNIFILWKDTLFYSGLAFMFWFRLEQCDNIFVCSLSRVIAFILSYWLHITIDHHTEIGYGFFSWYMVFQ